jgi:hypothetical protein
MNGKSPTIGGKQQHRGGGPGFWQQAVAQGYKWQFPAAFLLLEVALQEIVFKKRSDPAQGRTACN